VGFIGAVSNKQFVVSLINGKEETMPYKPGHPMYIRIQREKVFYEHAIEVLQAGWPDEDAGSFGEFVPLRNASKERVLAAVEYKLQEVRNKENPQKPRRSGPAWMRNMPSGGPTVGHADRFGNHIWIHPKNELRLSGVYYKDVYIETLETCTDRWGRPWQSLPWSYLPVMSEGEKQDLYDRLKTSGILADFINTHEVGELWEMVERKLAEIPKEAALAVLSEDKRQAALDILALYEAHRALARDFDSGAFLEAMQKSLGDLPQKAQRTLESDAIYLMAELDVTAYHILARFLLPESERVWMFPKGLTSSLQRVSMNSTE
jgi:hypothetical protein